RPPHEAVDVGLLLLDGGPEFGDGGEEFLVYPPQVRGLGPQGGEVRIRGRFRCHTSGTRHPATRFSCRAGTRGGHPAVGRSYRGRRRADPKSMPPRIIASSVVVMRTSAASAIGKANAPRSSRHKHKSDYPYSCAFTEFGDLAHNLTGWLASVGAVDSNLPIRDARRSPMSQVDPVVV